MFLFRTATTRQVDIGLMILRLVVGVIFIAHGGQKLFVYGFDGVTGAFGQMGVPFPAIMGPFVALFEFVGGLAFVAGLLTRLVSLGFAFDMVVAILVVHLKAGFFNPGVEFPLLLIGSALLFVIAGAGSYSLDALIAGRGKTTADSESARIRRAT